MDSIEIFYRNEKDRLLAARQASTEKVLSDLAGINREIELCRHSLEMAQVMLHRVGRHPLYRLLSGFRLIPPISLNSRGK